MTSSSFTGGAHHLQALVDGYPEIEATLEQRVDCLKLLKVVVKNLSDEVKSSDAKYRQLRLSNEKIRAKVMPCAPNSLDYLTSIGFVSCSEDGEEYLRVPDGIIIRADRMKSELTVIENSVKVLSSSASRSSSFEEEEKKSASSDEAAPSRKKVCLPFAPLTSSSKMSEKQKARLLMEEKRKRELAEDKKARAKNVAMIKQDNYVRKNDPNWKSKQSAACVKSGTGISTFRDKYGEN